MSCLSSSLATKACVVLAADPTGQHKLRWLSLSSNRLTTIPAVRGLAQLRTHMLGGNQIICWGASDLVPTQHVRPQLRETPDCRNCGQPV